MNVNKLQHMLFTNMQKECDIKYVQICNKLVGLQNNVI